MIHVFLHTNLIQIKRKLFIKFKSELMPMLCEYVNNETQSTAEETGGVKIGTLGGGTTIRTGKRSRYTKGIRQTC